MMLPKAALTVLLCAAVAVIAEAHPHVFISNRMHVVFGNGVLKGISFSWTFDQSFPR